MKAKQSGLLQVAVKSGLIVGILDAIAASLNAYISTGITPDRVFKFVASGAFGARAYSESHGMVWIGLLFHFAIAIGWTILFFFAFSKLKLLHVNKILIGMIYGIFIWVIMNFVVIPLSSIGSRPFPFIGTIIMIMIHMFVIGIPISVLTSKYYTSDDSQI
jgi:hypothetical protein